MEEQPYFLGGKEILIKSVVQGIPTFAMACFLLPKNLCDKLDTLTRSFWWKGNPDDRKICWVSWDNLGKSKNQGGLGFRNHRAFNEAMLARQSWRLLMNRDAYWARFIKGIYFPNTSFLKAARGGKASWAWMSLLHGRNLLLKGLRWQVNDGKSIDFWGDAWVPSLPNFKIPSEKPPNTDICLVVDVINSSWDVQKLSSCLPQEVVEAIISIPLPMVQRNDQFVWHYNANGCYSAKSGYHIVHQNQMENHKDKPESSFKLKKEEWKMLWKMKTPNKVKNFWWKACKNALATKENLFKRRCAHDRLCPICEIETESIEHMLFWCSWAKSVWFGCNIKPFGELEGNASITKWVANMVEQLPTAKATVFMEKVANIAWQIWKKRNDFVFNKVKANPLSTINSILHFEKEWSQSLEFSTVQMDNPQIQEEQSNWRAPNMGKFKANCYVAIPKSGNMGQIFVVIRDRKGRIVDGLTKTIRAESSLEGELQAIRMACGMVNNLGLKDVEVEFDNKQVTSLSVSELVPPWKVSALVQDIRHLAKEGKALLHWIRRSANRLAHEIASLALKQKLPCNWVVNPPFPLVSILEHDMNESL